MQGEVNTCKQQVIQLNDLVMEADDIVKVTKEPDIIETGSVQEKEKDIMHLLEIVERDKILIKVPKSPT